MTHAHVRLILARHSVHPKFWADFEALVFQGTKPPPELRTRLNHVTNYKAALDSILAELSEQVPFRFPPKVVQPLESLEIPA